MMLRCSALARATLRTSKQDVSQVTRTLSQLSIHGRSFSTTQKCSATGAAPKKAPTRSNVRKTPLGGATKTKPKTTPKKTPSAAKKKPVSKSKPTSKKKAVPKKAPTPRKRVLSEKGLARAEKQKTLTSIRELKAVALVEPKNKPDSAWTVYVSEKLKGSGVGTKVTEGIKSASAAYQALTAEEREHYNHIANGNKAENHAAYIAWVASYTPEQIRKANSARQTLKRKTASPAGKKSFGRGLSPIKDERQIKRPNSGYLKFSVDRRETGDFKGIPIAESSKLITKEWNELGAGEKKKYEDLHEADKERYVREFERTYGHAPPSVAASAKKAAKKVAA